MSLRVWLPLKGNLNNYGLSDVTVTNNGATVNTSGKIGSCYSFDGTNQYFQFNNLNIDGWEEISVACWCKAETLAGLFTVRSGGTHNFRLNSDSMMFRDTSNSTLRTVNYGVTIPANTWLHLVCTYHSGEIYIYLNGAQIVHNTTYYHSGATLNSSLTEIRVGRNQSTSGNIYYNGLLNDFRIYDHTLSAKEVKEIAKGLVLHYKLDQNINVLDNCYSYPTFNTSAATGGWNHWGPSGHAGTYSQNTDKQYIYNKNNTYSHCVDNTASATGKYYLCYQSPAFDGGYRSLQCIVKDVNGAPINETICYPGWNARSGGAPANKWTRIISLGDGFYLCQVDGLSQDGSNDLVSITVQPGQKIYISEAYLENNREICSDIFNQNNLTTIYDASGYNNNGIITGAVTTANINARYNAATYILSGNTDYITTSNTIGNPTDMITMNIWFKSSCTTPGSDYHEIFNHATNSQYFEFAIYKTGYFRQGITINGTRYVINGGTGLLDGNWHMLTATYNGTEIQRYIDGILVSSMTQTISGTLNGANGKFLFGHYGPNTSYYAKEAYLSDARIYATALSADDILELYNTSMSIDKNGNIHARELNETNGSRELLQGAFLTASYSNHNTTIPFTNFANNEITLTGIGTSLGTNYIPVSPTNKTYYYDIIVSITANNQFYLGFSRFDIDKTARSNEACVYIISTKPTADIIYQRYKGTVNLSTDGVNPTAYICLRVLNGWSSTSGTATIHYMSLREVENFQSPSVQKNGEFMVDELREYNQTSFYKNRIIEGAELLEN